MFSFVVHYTTLFKFCLLCFSFETLAGRRASPPEIVLLTLRDDTCAQLTRSGNRVSFPSRRTRCNANYMCRGARANIWTSRSASRSRPSTPAALTPGIFRTPHFSRFMGPQLSAQRFLRDGPRCSCEICGALPTTQSNAGRASEITWSQLPHLFVFYCLPVSYAGDVGLYVASKLAGRVRRALRGGPTSACRRVSARGRRQRKMCGTAGQSAAHTSRSSSAPR